MGRTIFVPRWVNPPDPYHIVIRKDYDVRPFVFEVTVCGLTVERWMTRSFNSLPWTVEEQRSLYPGCCTECAEPAYAAREACAEGVKAYLREVLP